MRKKKQKKSIMVLQIYDQLDQTRVQVQLGWEHGKEQTTLARPQAKQ